LSLAGDYNRVDW